MKIAATITAISKEISDPIAFGLPINPFTYRLFKIRRQPSRLPFFLISKKLINEDILIKCNKKTGPSTARF